MQALGPGWTGPGLRSLTPCFSFGASISATLQSLFSIRKRNACGRKVEAGRKRGQHTHTQTQSARGGKGGEQKHRRQNGFHSHSSGRPEVPYFLLILFSLFIPGLLSSLLRGIWPRTALSNHIKDAYTCRTTPCDKLVLCNCMQIFINLRSPRRGGTLFMSARRRRLSVVSGRCDTNNAHKLLVANTKWKKIISRTD